jgi:hypothetical protein
LEIELAGKTVVGYLILKLPPLGILLIDVYFIVYSAGSEIPRTDCVSDLVETSAKSVV